jgi:hypothetical protein
VARSRTFRTVPVRGRDAKMPETAHRKVVQRNTPEREKESPAFKTSLRLPSDQRLPRRLDRPVRLSCAWVQQAGFEGLICFRCKPDEAFQCHPAKGLLGVEWRAALGHAKRVGDHPDRCFPL